MSQALIDAVAKAIEQHFSAADRAYGEHIKCAQDAIAAIEASGTHVIVPAIITPEMMKASECAGSMPWVSDDVWCAMLLARPKVMT